MVVSRPVEARDEHNSNKAPVMTTFARAIDILAEFQTGIGTFRAICGAGDSAQDSALGRVLQSARQDNARQNLKEEFEQAAFGQPELLKRFNKDLEQFEARVRATGSNVPVSAIAETYDNVRQMLQFDDKRACLSQADRTHLAADLIHLAAHPDQVRQGLHRTCSVASVENRLYSLDPANASRVVCEAATRGAVALADGRALQLPLQSLVPDQEAKPILARDGFRSFASQVFQIVAVNEYYDRLNRGPQATGVIVYEQEAPVSADDKGERLWDYSVTPRRPAQYRDGSLIGPPGVPVHELETIARNLSGRNQDDFVIVNDSHYSVTDTVGVSSEKELGDALLKLQNSGQLPALLLVDTRNEPFFTDQGGHEKADRPAPHMIAIKEYDPATGAVQVDNQWQQQDDHMVSLHNLYRTTLAPTDPTNLKSYAQDLAQDRSAGRIDGARELDYLRVNHDAGNSSEKEYDESIIRAMKESAQRWSQHGETYQAEKQRTEAKFWQLMELMPLPRAKVIEKAVGTNMTDPRVLRQRYDNYHLDDMYACRSNNFSYTRRVSYGRKGS